MTPNTEPKPRPATDEEIKILKASHPRCGRDYCDLVLPLAGGVAPESLIVRIEQEREMRREAETLIWATEIAASSSGRNTFAHECKSFLARAAKMEEDYAR